MMEKYLIYEASKCKKKFTCSKKRLKMLLYTRIPTVITFKRNFKSDFERDILGSMVLYIFLLY